MLENATVTGGGKSSVIDLWHPVAALAELPDGAERRTRLLEDTLVIRRDGDEARAWRAGGLPTPLPAQNAFGYLWVSLGNPVGGLFAIPEYAEPDRRNMNAASFRLHVSAPRAVENFLDMGHFPFVHTNYLGVESHPEVKDYAVEVSADRHEVIATRCRFFQPIAALSAQGGMEVEYIYRVPHPYCAILYKSCPADPDRQDVIALFLQCHDEEHVTAHLLMCIVDAESSDTAIKAFQQKIFAQDKPILENQVPKRLPLDPRAEMPVRADKSSLAYRRWLTDTGIRYGAFTA